ncbi:hypothetical protein OIDMADRAFT_113786 [Oidiodendron maius Zn]|uniref:histidine kinase n=1 Tax=Oidiodendron maius (strain Zn) TaxID=913774 RepID=A0A0C3HTC5_OIDMZ|nr:hypothetical protein OIDMADRAFT_113786 [Oidiodendron maius Zn]
MRIGIREQLAAVVLVTALVPLAVLAIATWVNSQKFVSQVTANSLSLTASLKAAQVTSDLLLIQSTSATLTSRVILQNSIKSFYQQNTAVNWTAASDDISDALESGGLSALLQVTVFSRNGTGYPHGILNVTASNTGITLPSQYSNGSLVMLGDGGPGYPAELYPSLTYSTTSISDPMDPNINGTTVTAFGDFVLNNTPATANYHPSMNAIDSAMVRYVFSPTPAPGQEDRHSIYNANLAKYGMANFTEGQFHAVADGFSTLDISINNASTLLTTNNENNASVSVGYARPNTNLVDWLLIVEQSHYEAWSPIYQLRNIVLACVFGAVGLVLIFVVPFAHYSVRPIRRLREATKKSIAPPCSSPNASDCSDHDEPGINAPADEENGFSGRSKKGFVVRLKHLTTTGRRKSKAEREEEKRRRGFRIPAKVQDRKHLIQDELSDLTATFNDMTDELLRQYTSLESKVAARTQELEISKKAAEAANESKTLFIANISHELKTPLNGILGMCAVCMGEDDLPKIKRSLQVVYKSGDLLLHLLNDLLTFSKNQIGQQLTLDEREFHLYDIKTQILTIFTQQVQEGRIKFEVKFVSAETTPNSDSLKGKPPPALGPNGIGRLKDMRLWGDQHRILQVLINLVSNSLKFTPEGGKVSVRIRCLGDAEPSTEGGTRASLGSKHGSQRDSKRSRKGSESNNSQVSRNISSASNAQKAAKGTALLINPMDPNAAARFQGAERSSTPPPAHAKAYIFQFEVSDTGPGIPANLQERVFEPFVQADLGLSKKYGGTGLGLSICAQLATLMGGDITLVSSEGAGSTFKMRVPLKHIKSRAPSTSSSDVAAVSRPESIYSASPPDDSLRRTSFEGGTSGSVSFKDTQPRLVGLSQPFFASSSGASPATGKVPDDQLSALSSVAKESGTKVRVLVAEDNLVNQEVVLRMLKLEDIYDVVVAKDGQEAYEMVKASMAEGQFFNLIFMDVQMPNLSGIESTRLIRQMGYSAPIVALTAFAEESNMKECYDSGMDMFLSKPIRRPALKQVLKKFATIPEEAEPATTPEKEKDDPAPIPTPTPPPAAHLANGTASE